MNYKRYVPFIIVAWDRFELSALGVWILRSNQLSYHAIEYKEEKLLTSLGEDFTCILGSFSMFEPLFTEESSNTILYICRENLSIVFIRRYFSINDKRTVNLLTDNDQVRLERLELSRRTAPDPKSGVATYYTTNAYKWFQPYCKLGNNIYATI